MVFAMQDNLKHGKPLTSEDYKMVARQLYKDNLGSPVQELADLIKVSRKVFTAYVQDLVEDFQKEKDELILKLDAQGVPGTTIVRQLKKQFPKAKGLSQSQVSKFLSENDHPESKTTQDTAKEETTDASQAKEAAKVIGTNRFRAAGSGRIH